MNTSSRRYTVTCLAVLICLCGLIQAVVIARAAVPSIDCVRFVSLARSIDSVGFLETFCDEAQQPLFPLAIYGMHGLLRGVCGETSGLWALSAQLSAAAAVVLAVIPVYFISRRLAGPCGGFVAGVFFCVLPEVARLGGDGISDSLHLLLFAVALWALLEHFQRLSARDSADRSSAERDSASGLVRLGVAGLAVGLAILTRAETVALLPTLPIVAILCWLRGETRHLGLKVAATAAGVILVATVVIAPHLLAVGASSASEAFGRVLGCRSASSCTTAAVAGARWQLAGIGAPVFGVKEPGRSIRQRGWPAAVRQFGEELADAFGYVIGLLGLVGLLHMWRLRMFRPRAGGWLMVVFTGLFSACVIRFTAVEGYLSARHLLPLVAAGIGSSGVGAVALAHWMRQKRLRFGRLHPLPAVVFFFTAICLITTLRPLHAGRLAHRRAGDWLARAESRGAVLDTRGWTGLYSRRPTFRYDRAKEAFADPHLAYVVVERQDLQSQSRRGRTLRGLLAAAAEPAATFSAGDGRDDGRATVSVYRWYPQKFQDKIAGLAQPSPRLSVAQAHKTCTVSHGRFGHEHQSPVGCPGVAVSARFDNADNYEAQGVQRKKRETHNVEPLRTVKR